MDADEARKLTDGHYSYAETVTFANFTRELDFVVRRASTTGNTNVIVTAEIHCKEKAEQYLLDKGYIILDKSLSSSGLDYWFRISWARP